RRAAATADRGLSALLRAVREHDHLHRPDDAAARDDVAAAVTSLRRLVALAVAGLALSVGFGAGGAWAHSPTDFLKVPVGQQATVLLPPMRALPGLMQVAIDAPRGYRLTDVSAGPGWQARVAANAAVLDGRRIAGRSVLVT